MASMSIQEMLDKAGGVGAVAGSVRGTKYEVDYLVAGFDPLVALAADSTGSVPCKPSVTIRPDFLVADSQLLGPSMGFTSLRIANKEQFVGSGPVPGISFAANQSYKLKCDPIDNSPGATLTIINGTAATAVANAYIAVWGPAAVKG